jgi:hypothetical protein
VELVESEIPEEIEEHVALVIDAGDAPAGRLAVVVRARALKFADDLRAALPVERELHVWGGAPPHWIMAGDARVPGAAGTQTRAILAARARQLGAAVEEQAVPFGLKITMDVG